MKWKDGASYSGEWMTSKASGFGKFIHINGDEYMGMWSNDQANEFGIFNRKEDKNFN